MSIKTNRTDFLTTSQAAVVLINYIVATEILTLPRTTVEKVQTPDVWITVILGGIAAMLAGIIMAKLSQQFPKKTFYQYNQEIIGKWAGTCLTLLVVIYFFTFSAYEVRALAEVTSLFMLENTPKWAIIMPLLWIGLYLNLGGVNPVARLCEIVLPITIIFFLLAILMGFGIFEINNLRPVLGSGIMPVLKGINAPASAYAGPEIMLFLLVFMKKSDKAVKVVVVGVMIPMILYLITVVMVIGALSIDGVVIKAWPTIELIRSVEIQGLLFERFESLLLVIWIMQIFTTFVLMYYFAALGLAQLFKKNIQSFMFGMLPVVYIIAMCPKNTSQLFTLWGSIGNVAFVIFGLFPLLLLIITRLRRSRHEAKT